MRIFCAILRTEQAVPSLTSPPRPSPVLLGLFLGSGTPHPHPTVARTWLLSLSPAGGAVGLGYGGGETYWVQQATG